jgi:hypothetical protein
VNLLIQASSQFGYFSKLPDQLGPICLVLPSTCGFSTQFRSEGQAAARLSTPSSAESIERLKFLKSDSFVSTGGSAVQSLIASISNRCLFEPISSSTSWFHFTKSRF